MRGLFPKIAIFLFHVLFLVVPLIFTPLNDELFEFNKMLAVYVIGLLLAGCWVGESILKQKFLFRRTALDVPILIFLLSQIVSTIFSINPHTSIFGYYTRFNGGLLSTLSYIALYYTFVNFVKTKHLKGLVTSLIVGGVLSAAYAFPEHFGVSPSCYIITQKADVSCWVQDVKTRVFGTFGQPNWLAAYLGMLLPIVIIGVKQVDNTSKLWKDDSNTLLKTGIRLGVAALFVSVLFFTGSRSGMIALATGLGGLGLALILFWLKLPNDRSKLDVKKTLMSYAFTFAATIAIVAITTLAVPNPIRNKFLSLIQQRTTTTQPVNAETPTIGTQLEVGGSESGQIRNIVWKGAFKVWQRYPIFGSGVETFAYSYYKDRLVEHNLLSEWDFLYNKAHNEFLNFLATTGVVGLLSYLFLLFSFIVYPIKSAYQIYQTKEKRWKNQPEKVLSDAFLLLSLSAGILIVSISNFFGFSTVMVAALLFIFPALAVVIAGEYVGTNDSNEKSDYEVDTTKWILLLAVLGLIFVPIMYVRKMWLADIAYAKGKQLNAAGQLEAAFSQLRRATQLMPEEPTFHDEFSYNLASLSVGFARQEDATKAAEFASMAITESDTTVELNPVHTNFWKTRTKVFLTLAQLDGNFYGKAIQALESAQTLSPTDPKIVLYLALLSQAQGNGESYASLLKRTIELKPNFEEARTHLAKYYEDNKQPELALEQYRYMIEFINPNNQMARDKVASLSAKTK